MESAGFIAPGTGRHGMSMRGEVDGRPRLMMREVTAFDGIPVDAISLEGSVDRIQSFIEVGRRTGRAFQVSTINLEFLVNARRNNSLRAVLQQSDLCVPDGMPLVWASRLHGMRFPERVAGADLVPAVAVRCAELGFKVMLFGGGPGIAEQAASVLRGLAPGLVVEGYGGPLLSNVEQTPPEVLDKIRSFGPDVLFVAFGNPKQEVWINRYCAELGVPVAAGVGGTLDFLAGGKPRAPQWMQDTGTEWIFRLVNEPGRLYKRYLSCLALMPRLAFDMWTLRSHASPGQRLLTRDGSIAHLSIKGSFDLGQAPLTDLEQALLSGVEELCVDLTSVRRLDQATLASLFALGGLVPRLSTTGRSRGVDRRLSALGLGRLFHRAA